MRYFSSGSHKVKKKSYLHVLIKVVLSSKVSPPALWKSLSGCPSKVPQRPSVWLRSEPGAITVRLMPHSATSARTNAPEEKVSYRRERAYNIYIHTSTQELLFLLYTTITILLRIVRSSVLRSLKNSLTLLT